MGTSDLALATRAYGTLLLARKAVLFPPCAGITTEGDVERWREREEQGGGEQGRKTSKVESGWVWRIARKTLCQHMSTAYEYGCWCVHGVRLMRCTFNAVVSRA
jgi:hypothetical protein